MREFLVILAISFPVAAIFTWRLHKNCPICHPSKLDAYLLPSERDDA